MKTVSVQFDLCGDNTLCDGTLSFGDGCFTVVQNGGQPFSVPAAKIAEARQFTDIGCGRLELVPANAPSDGSENIPLCRFSMSCVVPVGEFCKVINHYLQSDELLDIALTEHAVCPTCGRHLIEGLDVCLFCVKKSYVFTRALRFFKKYLPLVVFSGVLMVIADLLSTVVPVFNQKLIDDYIAPAANASPYFDSPTKGIAVTAELMGAAFAVG